MNFVHGHILWLLLVFPPALVAFFWWAWRERQRLMTQFIQARLLPGLVSGLSPTRQKMRFALLIASVTLAIIALARPQWGFTWEESKQKGLDIVVAIDTSKSMLAEDIAPNRLTRAKLAALDLMQQAKSDRLGLVAFAGGAFLQCPLTIDDNAFRQSVEALDVNIIPQGGTAIAEAIHTALTAFKEGNNFKVLVLFTDGEDNDEGALPAAEAAAKAGMKIFTIGIGTAEGELLRVKDAKGRTDYIRDEQGNVVKSHLNEDLLQKIAGATEGGFYLPLRGAKTIDTLYEKGLAPLPKTEGQEKLVKRYRERYHWPLAAAIGLLLVEMLMSERKRERRAAKIRSSGFNRSAPPEGGTPNVITPAATVVLALLLLPALAFASPSSALREYQSGQYGAALKEYQQALQNKSDDPRLHFNAGAAAYRELKLDEAVKHFGEVLSAQDLRLQQQAYYNLGNTLYRMGDAIPDPQKKVQSWEGAVKQYDSAIKLNTNDVDAKFNQDFVKRKLEELKQQQQDKQDNKDQNQQDKQDQKGQKQDKQNDVKQDQKQDQQKQEEKKDQSSKPQQAKDDQQKKDEQKAQNQSDKKEPEQQPAKSSDDKSKEKPEDKQEAGQRQQAAAHAMTPQEAKQLLDAQKGDEKVLQFLPQGEPKRRERALKDW
jgi:Ca-activated chloride channel family protein